MLHTDITYFGPISFFKELSKYEQVYYDHQAGFTKMSFKNRMIITSSQGPLLLTIPIVGGRDQKTAIEDIFIAYDAPWREQHFKSITTNYQRSPYFEYYKDSLHLLYSNKPEKLVDFLLICQDWMTKQIKANWEIVSSQQTSEYTITQTTKHVHPWLPKNYMNCPDLIEYHQVFSDKLGFVNNACILDMLFCIGGKQTKLAISTQIF